MCAFTINAVHHKRSKNASHGMITVGRLFLSMECNLVVCFAQWNGCQGKQHIKTKLGVCVRFVMVKLLQPVLI